MRRGVLRDGLLTMLVSCLSMSLFNGEFVEVGWIALAILAIRYGLQRSISFGMIAGAVSGIGSMFLSNDNWIMTSVVWISCSIVVTLVGLFAKNIHRTLNNRRLPNVWLNVVTSVLMSGVLLFVIAWLVDDYKHIAIDSVIVYAVLGILVIMLCAYRYPKVLLTSRSAFLTSKERSKLLND